MAAQREWFEKDYYKTLGVSKTASDKEITKAYRKLAKQFHPDANPGDKKAEDRFKEAASAYDVLGDAAKRKEYDEVRSMARAPGAGYPGGNPFGYTGGAPAGGSGGAGSQGFKFEDLGDIFGGLFGGGGRARQRGGGPQRGEDLEAELHLAFVDAVNGVETQVPVNSDAPCQTCRGTGAEPGTTPVVCPNCGGRGVLDDNQGVFSFSRPCEVCNGSGRRIETPCRTCRGSGVQKRSRNVKVRIPVGVSDGQRIRLKGRGGAGRNGGPAGDLYVVVHVAGHPLFARKGNDLTIKVPVSISEATLGTTVKVPTLTTPVTLKVTPGTTSGRVLRVRERGVPAKRPGDLLVTVEVAIPKELTDDQRKLFEKLQKTERSEDLRSHLGVSE